MIAALRRFCSLLVRGRSATQIKIEALLEESIHDIGLYEQALRHKSVKASDEQGNRLPSYERMEYLGDAVLGLVVTEHLYATFPYESEGFLSPLRSKLVKGRALAEVARTLGLGNFIEMSTQTKKLGGRDQDSLLADSLEALIGALYLDRGIHAVKRFIHRIMLNGVDLQALAKRQDNFKSLLQEYVQARGWPTPSYELTDSKGALHERVFEVVARVGSLVRGRGQAASKKDAEQAAARIVLDTLEKQKSRKSSQENYKGRLHALVHARGWPKPKYKVISQQGPPHAPVFTVELLVGTMIRVTQKGPRKKDAQHRAAREALAKLDDRTADTSLR